MQHTMVVEERGRVLYDTRSSLHYYHLCISDGFSVEIYSKSSSYYNLVFYCPSKNLMHRSCGPHYVIIIIQTDKKQSRRVAKISSLASVCVCMCMIVDFNNNYVFDTRLYARFVKRVFLTRESSSSPSSNWFFFFSNKRFIANRTRFR